MLAIEKALATVLKDIDITLHTISVESASGLPREYNIAKANYFYRKAEENVKE